MNVYHSPFESLGDGSEDEYTLYSLANEFMESALALKKLTPTNIKYTSSIIYLLCHAAELFLKSILYSNGHSKAELKQHGHDLSSLLGMATIETFNERNYFIINDVSSMYKDKEFEYRKNKNSKLPCIDDFAGEVNSLKEIAFNIAFSNNA